MTAPNLAGAAQPLIPPGAGVGRTVGTLVPMGRKQRWIVLVIAGCAALLGCASEGDSGALESDGVEWAESVCATFEGTEPGLSSDDLPAPAEPTGVGEMREMLVDAGAPWPSEWDELDDGDRLAQCTFQIGTVGGSEPCEQTAPSGPSTEPTNIYLVDAEGHGVFIGGTEPMPPDC